MEGSSNGKTVAKKLMVKSIFVIFWKIIPCYNNFLKILGHNSNFEKVFFAKYNAVISEQLDTPECNHNKLLNSPVVHIKHRKV